jgi:hypothetical protein
VTKVRTSSEVSATRSHDNEEVSVMREIEQEINARQCENRPQQPHHAMHLAKGSSCS